jgi:RimJ/RimL family protein N-acetyltransferase
MIIETNRLRLHALNDAELQLLADSRSRLEAVLGLAPAQLELNADPSFMEEFAMAIGQFVLPGVQQHPADWLWYTHWLIIEKESNRTVGGIGLAGKPDAETPAYLGYFIDRRSEGRGYATEALGALLDWVFSHPFAAAVIADTPEGNSGSQRVLQKNGFRQLEPVEEGIRWRRERV